VWQAIYPELYAQGLEIIAVALDTGGRAAVAARIRAEDIAERPAALAPLMGWNEDLWSRQAPPTYPCLIDESHQVAALFGITNVPQAVWIDEQGRIVRPAESAGTSDVVKRLDRATFALPEADAAHSVANRDRYIAALRDWVANGERSRYVLSADEVRRRMRRPRPEDALAATHVSLARHLYAHGRLEAAKRHFREAVSLCPESWNYRRQSNMLDPESIGQLNAGEDFWDAVKALGDTPFYAEADLG